MQENTDLKTSEYGHFLRGVLLRYFVTLLIHQDMVSLKTSTRNKCQFIEPLVLSEAVTLLITGTKFDECLQRICFCAKFVLLDWKQNIMNAFFTKSASVD